MPSGDITDASSPRGQVADVSGDDPYISGEKWFTCQRSGWNFPMSRMRMDNGLRVADIFYDQPGGNSQGKDDPRSLHLDLGDNPYGL